MKSYCDAICLHIQAGQHPNLQTCLIGMLLEPSESRQLARYAGLENWEWTVSIDTIHTHLQESMKSPTKRLGIWARVGNLELLQPLLCQVDNGIIIAFLEAAKVGQTTTLDAMMPLRNRDRIFICRRALCIAAEVGQVKTLHFFEAYSPELLTHYLRLTMARKAIEHDHRHMLEHIFPTESSLTGLFENSLCSGSEELTLYILNRTRHISSFSLNRCFTMSAEKGYLSVMEGILARGGSGFVPEHNLVNFSSALTAATKAGQVAATQFLLDRPSFTPARALLSECLYEAIKRSVDLEVVRLLVTAGAQDFNLGLEAAAESGNLGAASLMLELGATGLEDPFYWAARNGHYELVVMLHEAGATNLESALAGAAYGGYLRTVKYLLSQQSGLPCEAILAEALDEKGSQNLKVIRYLLKRRPSNVRDLYLKPFTSWKWGVKELLQEYIKNEAGSTASSI